MSGATMQSPDPAVVNQVSETDRLWFEAHPGRSTYVRRFVPGEGPGPRLWFGDGVAVVVVRQVGPGARVRVPGYLPKLPPDTEQAACAALRQTMGTAR